MSLFELYQYILVDFSQVIYTVILKLSEME